jgi:hypothetical protein
VTDWWLSDMDRLAHAVGIIGMALMVLSMAYSLRKRKWVIRQGKITRWLNWHHWAGLVGGLLALGHTLGNLTGLGTLLIALLLLVLGTSGLYFLERRAKRPLMEAINELSDLRGERTRLDGAYRALLAANRSGTPEGVGAYNNLMAQHGKVVEQENRVTALREEGTSWTWWSTVHNVSTMMMVGVLLVHIWSKLYFSGVGL